MRFFPYETKIKINFIFKMIFFDEKKKLWKKIGSSYQIFDTLAFRKKQPKKDRTIISRLLPSMKKDVNHTAWYPLIWSHISVNGPLMFKSGQLFSPGINFLSFSPKFELLVLTFLTTFYWFSLAKHLKKRIFFRALRARGFNFSSFPLNNFRLVLT